MEGNRFCGNCGHELHGKYCPACGQKDQPIRQPIRHFLRESALELLGLDGRVWRSLSMLVFRPGRLTTDYLNGQRVRFVRPLRLYLTSSLVFFFLLTITDPTITGGPVVAPADSSITVASFVAELDRGVSTRAAALQRQRTVVDSLHALMAADSLELATQFEELREDHAMDDRKAVWIRDQLALAPGDSLVRPSDLELAADVLFGSPTGPRLSLGLPDWWPQSDAVRQMQAARTDAEFNSSLRAFFDDVLRRLPTVIFLLLPIFALLLKLLYGRGEWYYTEHLVFGLHVHAFVFLVFTILLALSLLAEDAAWLKAVAVILLVAVPVYVFVAQKWVYGQGWIKTALKATLLAWAYSFVLFIGMIVTVIVAAMF